ncbi:MAG TPA: Ig-like domain-containing protein [Candidatus Saccharimonadales bacterium]|nr:Ig-like domain-containing protein [Candidatus Saccharimonadales bacterium]
MQTTSARSANPLFTRGRRAQIKRATRVLTGMFVFGLIRSSLPAGNINLTWNPSPDADVAGYALYTGTNSGNYGTRLDAGNQTSLTVSNLTPGVNYYFVATAYTAAGLESLPSNEVTNSVPPAFTNSAPFITSISSLTIRAGDTTGPLAFRVWDAEAAPETLQLTATSSNPGLVPVNNIVFGGYGSNRTVTVTGLAGQSGNALVTLIVSDGALTSSSAFTISVVNPAPTVVITSPLEGANYNDPAAITIAASVNENGHLVTSVQFYVDSVLLGAASAYPYTLTANSVAVGSHTLSARVLYDSGTVDSLPVHVAVVGLPAPWQTADIGSASPGTATEWQGLYTVKGAGTLAGTADSFRFVYQTLSGNGEIKACVNSMASAGTNARIGVIIRESLTKNSKYAFIGNSPEGRFRWQYRNSTGAKTTSTVSTNGAPPNIWTRLVRTGNNLAGYRSTDGTNWALMSSRSISMATNIYVGLLVSSGSSNLVSTATFTNITVIP